jgi:hypothetical protein
MSRMKAAMLEGTHGEGEGDGWAGKLEERERRGRSL